MKHDSDYMTLALQDAPVDHRTGNKVIYNASWTATNDSLVGTRNEDWVRREIDWFTSGSNNLGDMEDPVPKAFQDCAGPDGVVNSAYGHILFAGNQRTGGNLLFRILEAFTKEGLETRHAIAIISDRDVHLLRNKDGRNDFICTNALTFMVDHKNQVHLTVQMRSMDAVWGYRADYSMWDYLLDYVVEALNDFLDKGMIHGYGELDAIPVITRGDMVFQVANLHVYPRHFELLQKWADKVYDDQERTARRVWLDPAKRSEVESADAKAGN